MTAYMRSSVVAFGLILTSCSNPPAHDFAVLAERCECLNGGMCIRVEPTPEIKEVSNQQCRKMGWLDNRTYCSFDLKTYDTEAPQKARPLSTTHAFSIMGTSKRGQECVDQSSIGPL